MGNKDNSYDQFILGINSILDKKDYLLIIIAIKSTNSIENIITIYNKQNVGKEKNLIVFEWNMNLKF